MTLIEMIKITGELPKNFVTANGRRFEVDVEKTSLGYMAKLWEVQGLGVKEHLIEYGTGDTPDKAKGTLKKKILKG